MFIRIAYPIQSHETKSLREFGLRQPEISPRQKLAFHQATTSSTVLGGIISEPK